MSDFVFDDSAPRWQVLRSLLYPRPRYMLFRRQKSGVWTAVAATSSRLRGLWWRVRYAELILHANDGKL
jgi:hypothetical protein